MMGGTLLTVIPLLMMLIPFTLTERDQAQSAKKAFIRGELLTYGAFYDSYLTGKVKAGKASMEVKFQGKSMDGRQTYHIVGEGRSTAAFSLFFHVNDRFESYVDEETLLPVFFFRKTHEGDYKYHDEVKFNQLTGSYSSTRKNGKMPPGTHDIVSAIYYIRTLDFSDMKPGDAQPVTFLLDDSVYTSVIRFEGVDTLAIDIGIFRCLHFKPMVVTGNVFSQPYPMDVWVTDDKNHIPVLAKSGVIIGSVKMELLEYRGLAHPLTSLIRK